MRCRFHIAHDVELDAVAQAVLVNATDKSGEIGPAVLHAGKTGYIYVHNQADCSLIRYSEPMVDQKGQWMSAEPDEAARSRCRAHVPEPGGASSGRRSRPIRTTAWPMRSTSISR